MAQASSILVVLFVAICAAGEKQDATQGGDYQKLVKQSATDYSKYTKSGLTASRESGNWKKYTDQYAGQTGGSQVGNFEQYTQQYASGQGGSDTKAGNYQQYLQKYAGGGSSGGQYEMYMRNYTNGKQYKQYVNKYAGNFFGGDLSQYTNMDQGGEGWKDFERGFSQYVDHGKKDEGYSTKDISKYVDQGKQGIQGTEKELSKYAQKGSKWSPADAASPSFLLEEALSKSTQQTKAVAEATDYQKGEVDAASRAQDKIEELKKFANTRSHPADLVSSIESEVQKEFAQERNRLQRNWVAKLNDLKATELAAAEWDEVERAFDAVADADEQLRSLDWEEFKAMRHAYHERREARKSHVRSLSHDARKASLEAKHLGRHAEDRQQSAGVPERVYELSWAQSEHSSERLALEAQKAGEAAEAMVDEDSQQAEALLEKRLEALKQSATEEQRARRLAEGKARKAVTEARAGLNRHIESQAGSGSPDLFVVLAADGKEPKQDAAQQRFHEEMAEAEGVVSQLRQLATREHEKLEENAAAAVSRIISRALVKVQERRQQAEREWKASLEALSAKSLARATPGEVHGALAGARHSQEELTALDREQLEAEREAYDHLRREEDEEARKLDAEARRAIGRLDGLGRHLRGRAAQEEAGRRGEELQREADATTRKVEEQLDAKFRLVEDLLSSLMNEQEEAVRKEQQDRREARSKAEEAIHVARRRPARQGAGEVQTQPASALAAFKARPDGAGPFPMELLAGATLCLGAVALAGAVHMFTGRRVRLNEELLLG